MSHVVVKPFKSINRKFKIGDKIVAADIDPTSHYTLADWIARGFVEAPQAPTPNKIASKPLASANAE